MQITFHQIVLSAHIVCGIIVLITGMLQILLAKGTLFHKRNGLLYFWSITGVLFTGLFLSRLVIILIGLFGYYYNLTGYRYVRLKNNPLGMFDRIIILCGCLISVGMLVFAAMFFVEKNTSMGIILCVFGLLFGTNTLTDLNRYILKKTRKESQFGKFNWMFEHFGRMYISYIMALTAFATINNIFHNVLLNWLLPTVIGTIGIAVTKSFYKKKMKRGGLLLLFVCFCTTETNAQRKDCDRRFKFAQSTLGIGLLATSDGHSAYETNNKEVIPFTIKPQLYPVLYFGGLHFWRRTEFYFSFPIATLLPHKTDSVYYSYNQSDIFAVKFYPFRLTNNALRPYLGISVSGANYQQKSPNCSGVTASKISLPILFGCTFLKNKHLFELAAKFDFSHSLQYSLSRTQSYDVTLPSFQLSLNYKMVREGTSGSAADYCSGKIDTLVHKLRSQNKLSAYYIGFGVSYAFFTKETEYNKETQPFLGQHIASKLIAEPALGYYSDRWNAFINLSLRQNSSTLSAYGLTQDFKRNSFSIECNKFLFDYNGFVPFAGFNISYEKLKVRQADQMNSNNNFTYQSTTITPGFNLGWDILPTKLEYFTLRTNIRYYPFLKLNAGNNSFSFQQFEFNIIQAVFYPQRFKWFRKLS